MAKKKFKFHGAFGTKKKAKARERQLSNAFVIPVRVRGQKRFAVVTKR